MDRRRFLISAGAGSAALAIGARRTLGQHAAEERPPHDALPDDHLQWWRDARFGMFVHFGLYSMPGGEWQGKLVGSHEWIRNNARIPHEEYIGLADRFNPVGFDADAYVRAAKDAGQRYLVFTTKHHEGFSLFDTKATTYGVMHTPFKRDIAGELARACHRHGVRIGWYYSIMDWYHPDYLPRRDWESRDARGADFSRYIAFMQAQLRELLTRYGTISVLWFDGQWESTWTHAAALELEAYCRQLMPGVIINDRIDVGVPKEPPAGYKRGGDYTTPELTVPERGLPGTDWETCMTMNQNWGWAKDDHDWKSVPTLVRLLVETSSKGGNLLLNVGPMGDGRFPQESIDGLRGMGAWLRVNGPAIYGTRGAFVDSVNSVNGAKPVRATTSARALHLFIDEWHGGTISVAGIRGAPRSARVLGVDGVPITTALDGDTLRVTLPERGPTSLVPVVQLQFDAPDFMPR
jgi:alpha-L-fucosidase